MIRSIPVVIAIAWATAATAAEPAKPAIKSSQRFPVAGVATSLETPPEADEIKAVYSPSSRVESTQTIKVEKLTPPKPGKPYLTAWIPERAGVVTVTAGKASRNISVRFDGIPVGGIIIMVIAGLILFGGVFVSMKSILSDG